MDRYERNNDDYPAISFLSKPGYYDSPEGTNPWQKIWGLSRYAIYTSLFMSINDAILVTQARNAVEAANCVGFWMVPLVGLSAAFSSVTYIATNIRGKDDKINYACGVLACTPVLHAWRKSITFTSWGTAWLMAAALLKKDSKQNGWEFFPKITREHGSYTYDFSLRSEEWPRRPM